MERKVKGSVVLDMVKVIRTFKDMPWDRYLTPGDFEIVRSMVIPTAWYSVEAYQRMGLAVYKLLVKDNDAVLEQFGQAAMKDLMKGPYRPFLERQDPFEAIKKFLELRKSLFNFSKMDVQKTGARSLTVRISEFGDFEEGMDIFMALLGVHFTELVKYNGGADVAMQTRQSPKDGEIVFELAWH